MHHCATKLCQLIFTNLVEKSVLDADALVAKSTHSGKALLPRNFARENATYKEDVVPSEVKASGPVLFAYCKQREQAFLINRRKVQRKVVRTVFGSEFVACTDALDHCAVLALTIHELTGASAP